MSADSPVLGRRVADGERRRDAVHVAIAPVTAAARLSPGEHVGFVADGDTERVGTVREDGRPVAPVGIVDPYLTEPVGPGDRFWLCLYPNSVTSLRHVWSSPAFARQVQPPKEG